MIFLCIYVKPVILKTLPSNSHIYYFLLLFSACLYRAWVKKVRIDGWVEVIGQTKCVENSDIKYVVYYV